MPFFQMDDGFDSEERVGRAGTAAFGLYSRCGVWVARNLKDGFVPDWVAAQYGSAEWARKLVEVGLWAAVDGGFMMPDYLTTHRNKTRARVEQERDMKAVRQANWLAAKKQKNSSKGRRGSSRDTRQGNGVSGDASQDGSLTPAPPLPSPKGEGVDAAPRSGGAAPPTRQIKTTSGRLLCETHHQEIPEGAACKGCAADLIAAAVDDDLDRQPPSRDAVRAQLAANRGMYKPKSTWQGPPPELQPDPQEA
jgi:hypothetical protein